MSRKADTNSNMYSGTPCDKCGGPTLAFPSGSIWCPDEDAHPGGHFVVRVAFERPPARESRSDWHRSETPRRPVRQPRERVASPATGPVERVAKGDGFDTGMDGFVRSES